MRKQDRWKPILRGDVYCSPACGSNCKKIAYNQAVKDSEALVKRLKGNGWRAKVWENSGWHYKAISGPIAVMPSFFKGKFWCMIADDSNHAGCGASLWTPRPIGQHKDPNICVKEALLLACQITRNLVRTLKIAGYSAGLSEKLKEYHYD